MTATPAVNRNVIPPITDPLGRYWDQPSTALIIIDDTHALMSRRTFDALKDYSATFPTGAYPGKMWKRNDGVFDREFIANGGKPTWMLVWFGIHETEPQKYVSNNFRTILLVD